MVDWNPTLEARNRKIGAPALVAVFRLAILAALLAGAVLLPAPRLSAQVDTVSGAPRAAVWVSHGHIEGHLALNYSSDGAFSPDGALLAVASDEKIVILDLRNDAAPKVLKPQFPEIHDLEIHSANFASPQDIFILANGIVRPKGKAPGTTPLLAFQWSIEGNHLDGKLTMLGAKGGFSPARYFPAIGYVSLYKDSNFELWKPVSNQGGVVPIPGLTQIPNLYEFSPDGHWLLLAQIQTTSGADPSVVELRTHKFVDELRGHTGTVLSMAFSRDTTKVVTACEDGKVRVYSVDDWKLIQTLVGHQGPVHRAEFSPDGKWIASVGEDHTMRVWSVVDGSLQQRLQESQEPLLDVAFSPDSRFIAASSENQVYTWKRQGGD
jgi:WD40 repeat protein